MDPVNLRQKILDFIQNRGLLVGGDRLLVAVSGGPDSMCLLHVLVRLKEEVDFAVEAAHFDHSTREGDSEKDADFVEGRCQDLGVPLTREKWSKPEGVHFHSAARKARYDFLSRIACSRGMNKVATAHQAEDQAETLLMRLIRGTGRSALMGIPVSRPLEIVGGKVVLIRPLANTRRQEIEEYLRQEGVPWVEDRSNWDPLYLRSRIRHELIPHLREEYNPRVIEALLRFTDIAEAEEDFLESQTQKVEDEILAGKEPCRVDRDRFRKIHPAIRRRALRRVLRELLRRDAEQSEPGLRARDVDEDVILRAEDAIVNGQPGYSVSLAGSVALRIDSEFATFELQPEDRSAVETEWPIELEGTTAIGGLGIEIHAKKHRIENWEGDIRQCTPVRQIFDFGEHPGRLMIRTCRPGDSFRPFGGPGRKKVSDVLSDNHIPAQRRKTWPVLFSGDEIAWVIGLRPAECFKLTGETRVGHWVEVEGLEL